MADEPESKRRRNSKGPSAPRACGLSALSTSAISIPSAQENHTSDGEAAGQNSRGSSGALSVISRIIEHHKCPITQQLLVDPVVAEDGHVYERRALELWLLTKKTSPVTNKPMGTTVVSALSAQQTVGELLEEGMLDAETSLHYFSDRGQLRATRTSIPGPDLDGAKKDFQRSSELASSASQRKVAEFQLDTVAWMQEGANLFSRAQRLQEEVRASSGPDLRNWLLDVGEAARSAVTWPLLQAGRMLEWQDLPKGSRVKVIDDACELQRLCSRIPPEAEEKVGWNAEMLGFAGKICTVQRVGDKSHRNYVLRREAPPAGRDFSFPYDALFLLDSA